MRRADRLLRIVQMLRRHRRPVTAQALADELEASRRTIHRDILDLQTSLVPIEGEAGLGYVLRDPATICPPLMFTIEEVEAIVLGIRLARGRGDATLARAADEALAKVAAVLPPPLAAATERSALFVAFRKPDEASFGADLAGLRRAVREPACLLVGYTDAGGVVTSRIVRPLALLFFAEVTLLGAWCELRAAYRFFRTDRIAGMTATGRCFDARNGALLDEMMANDCAAS